MENNHATYGLSIFEEVLKETFEYLFELPSVGRNNLIRTKTFQYDIISSKKIVKKKRLISLKIFKHLDTK